MCNFLSAIAYQNGDVFTCPEYTDSHEDMIEHLGLSDRAEKLRNWCRVEFTPSENAAEIGDPDKYRLTVDDTVPDWWAGVRDRVRTKLSDRIRKMVIASDKTLLLGGCWIIVGGKVTKSQRARIVQMLNCEVQYVVESKVGVLRGNSTVGELWENSTVGVLRGNSTVGVLRENSKVGELRENSKVGELWENSKVGELSQNSTVGVLWGNSKVENDYRNPPAAATAPTTTTKTTKKPGKKKSKKTAKRK